MYGSVGQAVDELTRLNLVALATGGLLMSLGMALAAVYTQWRFGRLVKSAERLAAGEIHREVRGRSGRSTTARLSRALEKIGSALRETHESATMDRLTGVSNRQALLGTLFTEVERAGRYGRPFSVAFVDIDHFKHVNDTYGHGVGDVVLR